MYNLSGKIIRTIEQWPVCSQANVFAAICALLCCLPGVDEECTCESGRRTRGEHLSFAEPLCGSAKKGQATLRSH